LSRIRTFAVLLACLCLVAIAQVLWGQAGGQNAGGRPGVPGYLDPRTGTFKPVMLAPDENAITATAVCTVTTCGGTFKVTLTITKKSVFPTGDTIGCSVSASTQDGSTSFHSYDETASVAATSAAPFTCVVTIPYSWTGLTSASTDQVTISYIVTVPGSFTSTTSQLPSRTSSKFPLATITGIPAPGAITAFTAAVTI